MFTEKKIPAWDATGTVTTRVASVGGFFTIRPAHAGCRRASGPALEGSASGAGALVDGRTPYGADAHAARARAQWMRGRRADVQARAAARESRAEDDGRRYQGPTKHFPPPGMLWAREVQTLVGRQTPKLSASGCAAGCTRKVKQPWLAVSGQGYMAYGLTEHPAMVWRSRQNPTGCKGDRPMQS